ncbi:MAG TPA: hypothetical protein DHS36_01210 [Candidatus Veblenbacteria bacterium]|uniref:Uncharacterized protein n=1 Tax=Candidatus Giovannonibacteria bacterium GW2011_GWF2_42_19 TaxID=1618659 RepID=A0A0G1BLT2_9BACT|nr:MAG: hypothetical protein UV11_C0018G0002 [Candidatus Giovannonibacteria bacterium GW2011_GWF2_42_19]HCX38867.1 hypothetical protein [Candidatus Veblenbacteria bacterium]
MSDADFKKLLEVLIPLVSSHAVDAFQLHNFKDFQKFIRTRGTKEFTNKCYEGFKIAQESIVKNLLVIESEIETYKEKLSFYKKGKKIKQLSKDKQYIELVNSLNKLILQRATIHEVANVIVWTIYLEDRTVIKSFIQKDGNSGYLKDRNIESLVEYANKQNQKEGKFALIHDITSTLNIGDLTIVEGGGRTIAEMKSGGRVEEIISTVLDKLSNQENKLSKSDVELLEPLYFEFGKAGLQQLKRSVKQLYKMSNVVNYEKTGKMMDEDLKREKRIVEILEPDKDFGMLINLALEDLYNSQKEYIVIPLDTYIVGIFRRKINESESSNKMNFRHYVYHLTEKPWEKCDYINLADFPPDRPIEYILYHDFRIYSLRDKVFFPTHRPIFSILKSRYAIELIMGNVDIYIYFDHDRFVEMCKEKKLPVRWQSKKEILKESKDHSFISNFPLFKGNLLSVGPPDNEMTMGYGILFRMIYEFQSGYNVIDQMKEGRWINKYTKLSEARLRLRRFIENTKRMLLRLFYKAVLTIRGQPNKF